LNKILY